MFKYLIIFLTFICLNFADNIRPLSGSSLTYIYVPFEWEQEADAINYNLQISTQQSFNNIIVDIQEPTTVYVEKENLNFQIFYGVSNNKWRFWDLDHARKTIGYDPKKNAENER